MEDPLTLAMQKLGVDIILNDKEEWNFNVLVSRHYLFGQLLYRSQFRFIQYDLVVY